MSNYLMRTIEQILGLPPMNQFDLVASPMRTAFVKGDASAANFKPWTHAQNQVPLDEGVSATAADRTSNPAVQALRKAWLQKKEQIFRGKMTKPDSEDPDTVNHLNWYLSTGFKRPHPGEKTVRPPSIINGLHAKAREDKWRLPAQLRGADDSAAYSPGYLREKHTRTHAIVKALFITRLKRGD